LQDLCVFCNNDTLPAVAQAAIAHAQFETIHPFADGNGRVGRALIYMVLRRRALILRTIPPISLVLATPTAADLLLKKLPGTPILTVQSAAALIDRSVQAVNEAIPKLLEHGILSPITTKRRHRTFEAKELVAAFTDLERRLTSPAGDTRISRPTRKVPYRLRLAQ